MTKNPSFSYHYDNLFASESNEGDLEEEKVVVCTAFETGEEYGYCWD